MEEKPLPCVYFHFRFKFLTISLVAFLMFVILSGSADFSQFSESFQYKLMGPIFIMSGVMFLLFRQFPIKCPHCYKVSKTKKDWVCRDCGKSQGKARYLMEKCVHCKQMQAVSSCDHCKKDFRL